MPGEFQFGLLKAKDKSWSNSKSCCESLYIRSQCDQSVLNKIPRDWRCERAIFRKQNEFRIVFSTWKHNENEHCCIWKFNRLQNGITVFNCIEKAVQSNELSFSSRANTAPIHYSLLLIAVHLLNYRKTFYVFRASPHINPTWIRVKTKCQFVSEQHRAPFLVSPVLVYLYTGMVFF